MRGETEEMYEELLDAAASVGDKELCRAFFEDLLTGAEREQLSQRLRAAKLLLEGQTYSRIIEATDISSATLSRVSNCVRRGNGGYEKVLRKAKLLPAKKQNESATPGFPTGGFR